MKKKRPAILFVLVLILLLFPLTVYAEHTDEPRVIDNAGILDGTDYQYVTDMLTCISEDQDLDVVLFIEEEIDPDYREEYGKDFAMYCCADLFDYGGYSDDGLALLISVGDRKWALVTEGEGDDLFNSSVQKSISSEVVAFLRDDDFIGAAFCYAETVGNYLGVSLFDASTRATEGNGDDETLVEETADDETEEDDTEILEVTPLDLFFEDIRFFIFCLSLVPYPLVFGISAVLAFIVAFIRTAIAKAQLKSVRRKETAASYVVDGSLTLRSRREIYLYTEVVRTERQESDSDDSSSFTSSSGDSHTGSSGDF